jgi:gas vesicle protein
MIGRRRRQETMKRVAIGSVIAGAAGYLVGVLTAPKSGKQTRQDIKATANKGKVEAERELKKLHTDLGKSIDEAKVRGAKLNAKARQELNELVIKAKDTKEKVREVLSALHEGDADDKDLSKAVKQANQSLNNLKKYLKK